MYTHNPTVHFFNGKYYLYYTGNFGRWKDYQVPSSTGPTATTSVLEWRWPMTPMGPGNVSTTPLIDVSDDQAAHDAQMVANPSVTRMPDGRFLMVYKAVASQKATALWRACSPSYSHCR
jgi:hypothetical protein